LSSRPANYEIHVRLDHSERMIYASQTVRFTNQSPVPVKNLRLYLYFNAFKNTESSFLKGANQIFGQGFSQRTAEEWGWVDIQEFTHLGQSLAANMRFVQPDDGNPDDQSVLEVVLQQPVQPGETTEFKLEWQARVPKTIARAGYSKDFYLFCHWFPQLGVFEQNASGQWDWNCHQFFRMTEFYADFGVYDVHITTDSKFVVGASGCLVSENENPYEGTTTRHFHVEDVIDFAWSIYPRFNVQEDRWRNVQIRLLIAPEHASLGPRYLHALKFSLEYMHQHLGEYPYPSITVVDPPFHGLRSGLMEYPTLITVGTFYGMPEGIRTMESLVIHEFVHQYFMGILASNEKEEAWLDEGFVTYFEDRIIDAAYGPLHGLIDIWGYGIGNRELTRTEYTAMPYPRGGITARPGWEFTENTFKPLIYSKTATTLRTLHELMGEEHMDTMLRTYFERWKFKHPKGTDFKAVLQEYLYASFDSTWAGNVVTFFENGIEKAVVLDYGITKIVNEELPSPQGIFGLNKQEFSYQDGSAAGVRRSVIELQRKGDWIFPVEIRVLFEDGTTETYHWDGIEGCHTCIILDKPPVVSAQIDPYNKIGVDLDLNNNSLTLAPNSAPLWKYAVKTTFWVQNLFQSLSFLM
ncbi:MAG: M1 family metallopeptidase, partial [Saprospiraceae bacterium]|nr:M1 family metallopeptidase [Saprospiraceae bacterium]